MVFYLEVNTSNDQYSCAVEVPYIFGADVYCTDPSRFRLTHETSFVKDHTNAWTRTPALFYFVRFYKVYFSYSYVSA